LVITPFTLLMLMIFTFDKGKSVLSFTTTPATFLTTGGSCATTIEVTSKNKEATIYFIIKFDGLKILNLLKYMVASLNNYKKIND